MRLMAVPCSLTLTVVAIGACGGAGPSPSITPTSTAANPTAQPTPSLPIPTATPTSTATATAITDVPCLDGDQVIVAYDAEAQIDLRCGSRRVLIDVERPDLLLPPAATAADILLITHGDRDHLDPAYANPFPGQKVLARPGSFDIADVHITAIAAAHGEEGLGDEEPVIDEEQPDDVIYVIEMAGLRIVHFGDIGQGSLTPSQAAVVGRPDIAISQLENGFSSVNLGNHKGFDLIDSLGPRLFIITHISSSDTARAAAETWPSVVIDEPTFSVSTATLPIETTALFMGRRAPLGERVGVPVGSW